MNNVTNIAPAMSAQQRKQDREMLICIDWQLQHLHETKERLMANRSELVNPLWMNKPDGRDAA